MVESWLLNGTCLVFSVFKNMITTRLDGALPDMLAYNASPLMETRTNADGPVQCH